MKQAKRKKIAEKAVLIPVSGTLKNLDLPDPGMERLQFLQKKVGGYVEVHIVKHPQSGELVHLVVDEDGKLKNSTFNRVATVVIQSTRPTSYIVGDAVLLDGFLE